MHHRWRPAAIQPNGVGLPPILSQRPGVRTSPYQLQYFQALRDERVLASLVALVHSSAATNSHDRTGTSSTHLKTCLYDIRTLPS